MWACKEKPLTAVREPLAEQARAAHRLNDVDTGPGRDRLDAFVTLCIDAHVSATSGDLMGIAALMH
jgi:hypothetical protein